MICENCHENMATVHVERVIDGVRTESFLCPQCAVGMDGGSTFESFFKNFIDTAFGFDQNRRPETKEKSCQRCGMTMSQFKTVGRLGCADCYETFKDQLVPIIKRVQGGLTHQGKYPPFAGESLIKKRSLERLKKEIAEAVAIEDYETAAVLRDKIRSLGPETENGVK